MRYAILLAGKGYSQTLHDLNGTALDAAIPKLVDITTYM